MECNSPSIRNAGWGFCANLFGPYLAFSAATGKVFFRQFNWSMQLLVGAIVTVVGWKLLKLMFNRPVWRPNR